MARPNGRRWPNVERFVRAWLVAQTGRDVYTETPGTFGTGLPAYQITRVGGSDAGAHEKEITVEVDTIAARRGEMWDAAADAQTAMDNLRANGTADFYVDDVREVFAPAVAEYENPELRRATATYALTIRPH